MKKEEYDKYAQTVLTEEQLDELEKRYFEHDVYDRDGQRLMIDGSIDPITILAAADYIRGLDTYLKAEKAEITTRWIPGYLIRHKANKNRMAIVEGDYAYLHGGRGVDSLSIGELDSEGKVESVWAWAHRDEWELLDTEHVKENILKLVEFKDKVNSI